MSARFGPDERLKTTGTLREFRARLARPPRARLMGNNWNEKCRQPAARARSTRSGQRTQNGRQCDYADRGDAPGAQPAKTRGRTFSTSRRSARRRKMLCSTSTPAGGSRSRVGCVNRSGTTTASAGRSTSLPPRTGHVSRRTSHRQRRRLRPKQEDARRRRHPVLSIVRPCGEAARIGGRPLTLLLAPCVERRSNDSAPGPVIAPDAVPRPPIDTNAAASIEHRMETICLRLSPQPPKRCACGQR